MPKPFFYKLNASDFFSVVRELSDKECAKWLRTFASDLVAGNTKNQYTQSLIDEALKFKENKSLAGKKGMEKRYQRSNSVITVLDLCYNNDITNMDITRSNNSNRSNNNNNNNTKDIKSKAVAETVKPLQPTRKKISDEEWILEIKKNPAYEGIDIDQEVNKCAAWCMTHGKKHSRARLLNWFNKAEKPYRGNGQLALPSNKFKTFGQTMMENNKQAARDFVGEDL